MTRIFKEDLNDYEKTLVRILFRIYNSRDDEYSDASGFSMLMNLDSEFGRTLKGDEFSGIVEVEKSESGTEILGHRDLMTVRVMDVFGNRHKVNLTEVQARQLLDALQWSYYEADYPEKNLKNVGELREAVKSLGLNDLVDLSLYERDDLEMIVAILLKNLDGRR